MGNPVGYADAFGMSLPGSSALVNVPGLTQAEVGSNWVVRGSPSLAGNWTIASESQAIQNASAVQSWTETFERTYVVAVESANSHCDPTTGQQVYDTDTEIVEQRVTVTFSRQNNQLRNTNIAVSIGLASAAVGAILGPIGFGAGVVIGVIGGGAAAYFLPPYGPTSVVAGAPEFVPVPPVNVTGVTPEPP